MRYLTKFAGAGLVLIAATACAGQPAPANPAAAGQPPASNVAKPAAPGGGPAEAPAQSVPDGSVPVPAKQIDASSLPADYPRIAFVSRGGTVVSVKALEGGCSHASATTSLQDAQKVVVNLAESTPNRHQMCTMDIRYPMVSVPLGAALGDRTLVIKLAPSAPSMP
jgi:hypothetical protein